MKTNYFELRGIAGNPAEVRFTPNGKMVETFSLYTRTPCVLVINDAVTLSYTAHPTAA
jgi:hypothetical protein